MNKDKMKIAKKVIVPLNSFKKNFKEPLLMIIMGIVGAGKSTIGKKIAKKYPFYYASADNVRVALCKNPDHCSVETHETYSTMYNIVEELLKEKKSVIIDATMPKKKYREELQIRFEKLATTILLFIDRSPELIKKRVAFRKEDLKDPLNITFDLDEKLLERFLKELEKPKKNEMDYFFSISNNNYKKVDNELVSLEKFLNKYL